MPYNVFRLVWLHLNFTLILFHQALYQMLGSIMMMDIIHLMVVQWR